MKELVYIVLGGYAYEGDTVLHVYSSEQAARERVAKLNTVEDGFDHYYYTSMEVEEWGWEE